MCQKTVVRMTALVAALLAVHSLLSFLADVDRLLDPSGGSAWFPVDHWCINPVFLHTTVFLAHLLTVPRTGWRSDVSFFWWRLPVAIS